MSSSEYNRGTMLGLTLAEIMILILFLLLMLLSVLLFKEKERAKTLADTTKKCRITLNNIDDNTSLKKDVEATIKNIPQIIVRIQENNLLPEQQGLKVGSVLKQYVLVRDAFGNPIGYADNRGKAVTFSNEILGKEDNDGNIVNENGDIVGTVSEDGRVVGNKKGKPVGYEDSNGNAVSQNGNILGKVDENNNVIRPVSSKNTANGERRFGYIGYADNNIAYDFSGNEIGKVKTDQNIFDNSGNLMGHLSNKAILIKNSDGIGIGYMNALGRIKGEDNQTIAVSDMSGNIFKATPQIFGHISDEKALVYDENGNVIGYLDSNNIIFDQHHEKIGYAENDGTAIALDGSWLGHIGQRKNLIKDNKGILIGFKDGDGRKYTLKNNEMLDAIGDLQSEDRLIRNHENNIIGYIYDKKLKMLSGKGEYKLENGVVIEKNGKGIGTFSDIIQIVKDDSGSIVGYKDKTGLVSNFDGKIIGITDNAGDVLSSNGKKISSVDLLYAQRKNGKIYSLATSAEKGKAPLFDRRQAATNNEGDIIGYEDDNGNIKDFQNKFLGSVDENGKVFDDDQNGIGEIRNFKHLIIPPNDSKDFAAVINAALDCLEMNKYKKNGSLYACNSENKRLNREMQNLQGQNKNLQKSLRDTHDGNGGWGTPPCWATPDGKAEFIYNVYLEDNGLIIRANYLANRETDMNSLPIEDVPLDTVLSAEEFLKATKPLYQWGQKHSCNFFVNMYDNMNSAPRETYKALRKSVEGHFYIREVK